MTPPVDHTCAQCGRPLPDQSLGQRCPNCLLQLALTPPPEEFIAETSVLAPGRSLLERRFFGNYELLEEISRGGMGVVYRARQFNPDREVALKMIHPAGRATPAARLRFEVEIAAVARLQHPRIVALYESGEHDGVCFFSMRLVEGAGLDQRLADGTLPKDHGLRVDLLIKVAEAVHHAHQRGILHRDLKPSNILLDRDDEPCIADFGLAKIQESDAGLTHDQSVLGSPSYMAPEQASGKGGEVTTAADVYSLGAILYELLTGRPPFQAKTPLETLRQVAEQPPVPPRQLVPELPRDLESICLKALEKKPARRYPTALELAEDLERWRQGETVLARPITTLEQAWRWCRRRPAWAALLSVSLLSLITLAVGSTMVARRLQVAGDETRQLVRRLQQENAEGYLEAGETSKGLAMLAHLLRERPADAVVGTRLMSALSQRSLAVPMVPPWPSGAEVLAVGFTRDGHHSAGVARNGTFRRLELATGRTWDATLAPAGETLSAAALSEDGGLVATAHSDGRVRLWRTDDPHVQVAELSHETPVKQLVFNANADIVATVDQRSTVLWWRPPAPDARVGTEPSKEISSGWTSRRVPLPAGEAVNAIKFSPDGRWFGSVVESGALFLLQTETDATTPLQLSVQGRAQMLAFDAANQRVAVASSWNTVLIWSLAEPAAVPMKLTLEATCTDLEFSPDGRFLAAAGWSAHNRATVWDTTTGEPVGKPLVHHGNVTSLKFSPDGRELLTQGHDHRGRRWNTRTWEQLGEPLVHVTAPLKVAYDQTGRRLVTGSYSGVAWWDLSPPVGEPLALAHEHRVTRGAFSPDGSLVATGTSAGRVHLWNAKDGGLTQSFPAQTDPVLYLHFNHAGDRLITFGLEGTVRFWDGRNGEARGRPLPHPAPIYSVVFSPDDQRVLTAGTDGIARQWNLAAGELMEPLLNHGAPLTGAEFDPAGKRIVTYGRTNELRLWDAETGRQLGPPLAFGGVAVDHAEFSPDGRLVLAAGRELQVRLWDAATGKPAGEPMRHQNSVTMAVFSPDAAWLASASIDATVQVLRLGAGTTPVLIPHAASVTHVSFSPDSRWLLTASQDQVTRMWDPATGLAVTEPLKGLVSLGLRAGFSADTQWVLTLGNERHAYLWPVPNYRAADRFALATVAETVGRMTTANGSQFLVSPPTDWQALPQPFDLSKALAPAADRPGR